MTTETERPASGHEDHGVRSEEDRISTPAVIGVGVAALLLFFLASVATSAFMHGRLVERGPIAIPPEIGDSKIGMVEQQLFNGYPLRGERDRARRLERLGSYGWVDRGAGVVHVPIQQAMDLVAQGVRPQGAPAAGASPGGQP
ncbi:hypothetical protein [Anaeromyxobacter oryzae]|uniref:Uncharacterized protein n=1 Tax=Anaeromyxobacter oryzae TaxID=2918170 RepID=A0ABN6MU50_9BACT|nr:hypothetical protein [Anaeromyxobacter oryzae]BDG04475.1 hypothetical protein AMOR_34710 [Anaeromyxobacter oryzae]